jgi:hypothetical protein
MLTSECSKLDIGKHSMKKKVVRESKSCVKSQCCFRDGEQEWRVYREPELGLDFLLEQVERGNYVYTAPCGEEPVG